jgi:formylglycine-generating enzyme required for sulfatase activity/ethanolamine utilization microcompartment shell protein EutS
MKGILQVQQVTQQLSLAAVYVPLKATTQRAVPGELIGRVAGRWQHWAGQPVPDELAAAALSRQTEPVRIEQALKTDPAVVVLGDPGAGKSTLLKVLALALADEPGDETLPLPILLPLNAYAGRLQQGELNLSQFLGDYYATRQRKLGRVGALFDHALAGQRAVMLLDGLDEVQADRQYLVRLVQDFVNEHIPPPADTPDAPPVLGNRIVVTSRLVGYEEAPLAGRQWRAYTLTDFDQADIEQFIDHWTQAFALSVQGDTGPARQQAAQERDELLAALASRPSVRRLAGNPLLLTILAMIKYTGVTLPEQRVKLYELYLEALIESWNRARSLDQKPAGPGINYEETVQVLAPLALWLRRENPTAGLVSRSQLARWLADYYRREWALPPGEARRRGQTFLDSVERYSNLLLERGEGQYGFLHLTLEEMLAAKGLAQLYFDDSAAALELIEGSLAEPGWHETLQLAVGAMGVVQQLPRQAGVLLQAMVAMTPPQAEPGFAAIFAGQILLDVGVSSVGRAAAQTVTAALVETMQAAACPIRLRRNAGDHLGRLGWRPAPAADDLLLAPAGHEPTGLDTFRSVPGLKLWIGKYPITNYQFARFIEDGGYDKPDYWSDNGWAYRNGANPGVERIADKNRRDIYENQLANRPREKRSRPFYWNDTKWNSPLFPVVGISRFEAEAYSRWLNTRLAVNASASTVGKPEIVSQLAAGRLIVRLPKEEEWAAALGGQGDYPWGDTFDPTHLNCADAWAGRDLSDGGEWGKWIGSEEESWREASTTAVTTYPQGVSAAGAWDGSGNVWEWMGHPYSQDGPEMALRGGGWRYFQRYARVSARSHFEPADFNDDIGVRLVVAPVFL